MINLASQKSEIKSIELSVKEQKKMINQYVAHVQLVMKNVLDKFMHENASNSQHVQDVNLMLKQLEKENEKLKEQARFFEKKIDSFESSKHELNSHIEILNMEIEKSKCMSTKLVQSEHEKRKMMEENSGIDYFSFFS
jgi:hypothetical protein